LEIAINAQPGTITGAAGNWSCRNAKSQRAVAARSLREVPCPDIETIDAASR
jgi:hypothetical protein